MKKDFLRASPDVRFRWVLAPPESPVKDNVRPRVAARPSGTRFAKKDVDSREGACEEFEVHLVVQASETFLLEWTASSAAMRVLNDNFVGWRCFEQMTQSGACVGLRHALLFRRNRAGLLSHRWSPRKESTARRQCEPT